MKKDYINVLLGYRDYNQDEKYGKDFLTLDSVVEWLSEIEDRSGCATKEFFDFVKENYSFEELAKKMEEMYPNFPFLTKKYNQKEKEIYLRDIFSNIDDETIMHAADFTDTKIPQK